MRRFSTGLSAALATLPSMCPGLSAAAARARAGRAGGGGAAAAPGDGAQPLARAPATAPLRAAGAEPGPVRVTLIQPPALDAFARTGNRSAIGDAAGGSAPVRATRGATAARSPIQPTGARGAIRHGAAILALAASLGGTAMARDAAPAPGSTPAAAPGDAPGAGAAGTPPIAVALSPEQRAAVLALLRDALRADPSILRDAIAALARADAADAASARREALLVEADALFRDPADPVLGNPRGDVTLVEFFDARCGYCKTMAPAVAELLRRDNGVRLVLKDLPILGPNSVLAARALLAAQRQNRYAPLHEALMRLRAEPTEPVLRDEAIRLGLDWPRLRRDMDDPAVAARLGENLRLARALGIEGTPALVAGAALLPGAADLPALERLVADARRGG